MSRHNWLNQIRSARSTAEQIGALKALKNDIVGHPIRKQTAVALGVIEPIARLTLNKAGSRNDGKGHDHSFASRPLNEDESLRLQGLQILASIATGGPSFLAPLQPSLPAILSNLCPSNNPARLVLACLRALSNLADASVLLSDPYPISSETIAEALFTRQYIAILSRILSQTSNSATIQCQANLATSLIGKLCKEERYQQSLATLGVLDALATRLAGCIVAEGYVIPGAELLAQRDGLKEYFPKDTSSNVPLALVLEAISVIITNSKLRASQLLYSPSILAVLPVSQSSDILIPHNTRSAWAAFNAAGLSGRQSQLNALDYLLPYVPIQQMKTANPHMSAFPPLGSFGTREELALGGRANSGKYVGASNWGEFGLGDTATPADTTTSETEEPESPLIPYLLVLFRSKSGMEGLMAASVLAILYRTGITKKTRETDISLSVVPRLVKMLDDSILPAKGKDYLADVDTQASEWAIKERAPAVLAMLMTDSEILQKAAFDANVVANFAKMLKVSYDPVIETPGVEAWSPHGDEDLELGPDAFKANYRGQSPLLVHKIKIRESTLKAIAAISLFEDAYRKAIVELGTVPYIVESMNPMPSKPAPPLENGEQRPKTRVEGNPKNGYGTNTVGVLIAACGAIRALSRSVGILRTTLIDGGVAMPVFNLLKHPDIEVQIAATATVCNLVTDVSPMRDTIGEAGVLKILCHHVHSTNAKLRLNALWALKHYVHSVDNNLKKTCLEELGQGWLVQLICDDTEDEALSSSRISGEVGQGSNLDEQMDEDVEMDQFEDNPTSGLGASFGRSSSSRPSSSRSKSIKQAELRLAALRDAETNPTNKARKDDIAVQEQGLDFIRNLIGGAGAGGTKATTEMIDFLFNALGQDRVFDILASKLRSKIIHPSNRRGAPQERLIVPPQSEIIAAVGYILVHMAASVPRHRQLVIAQTDLLKLLVPQFNHASVEVRLALCWLITNLTWMDDANDAQACCQRANELKSLGFLAKLETLEKDPELNVRERAKSALWQLKQGTEYAR